MVRPPYQVLIDADMIIEACKCKMDLGRLLEISLQGQIKPSKSSQVLIDASDYTVLYFSAV